MRRFIFTLVLLLITSNHLTAQVEWEMMPNHGNEIIQIVNTLRDGGLVGYLEEGRKIYGSKDWGSSWYHIYNLQDDEGLKRTDFSSVNSNCLIERDTTAMCL